jgi:MFS family permease
MSSGLGSGKNLIYTIILSLGSFTFGYIISFPSPADRVFDILVPSISKEDPKHTFFKSVSSLTAIVGPFLVNILLSPRLNLGRRITCFIIAVTGCMFWMLQVDSGSPKIELLIAGRALLGLTMGCFSSLIPLYVVELAPSDQTGCFGTFPQVFIALGVTVCWAIGSFVDEDHLWDALVFFGAGIDGLLGLLIWFVPESPACIQERNRTVNESGESLFSRKWFRWIIIAAGFGFFQQFTGVNAIVTDLHDLLMNMWKNDDKKEWNAGIGSFVSSVAQVIACGFSGPLIERWGRDKIWTLSFALCAVADVGLAVMDRVKNANPWYQVAFIFLHLFGFGLGAGPIAWFIVPEMLPTIVRPTGVVLAAVSNWICSFAVIHLFPTMKEKIHIFGSFLLFGVMSIAGSVFGFFCIRNPELDDERVACDIYDDLTSQ